MKVLAICTTLEHPFVGIYCGPSLMSTYLLLQLIPAGIVHFTLNICGRGSKWFYSCCFVGSFFQYLFKTARSILVNFLSGFFSVSLDFGWFIYKVVRPQLGRIFHFYQRTDFHIIDYLSIVIPTFPMHMFASLSVDEILLPRCVNCSSNFRGELFKVRWLLLV